MLPGGLAGIIPRRAGAASTAGPASIGSPARPTLCYRPPPGDGRAADHLTSGRVAAVSTGAGPPVAYLIERITTTAATTTTAIAMIHSRA
jgi:hypothetical protein